MVALVVDVRFLDDRYHGMPEWPPSPGRLFQALVAAAAEGGGRPAAADAALRWLEALPPPVIVAPAADRGRGYTAYVPNNDTDAEADPTRPERFKKIEKPVRALLLPEGAVVSYLWDGIGAVPEGLAGLVHRLCQLGRGVDPAFAELRLCEAPAVEAEAARRGAMIRRPSGTGAGGMDCPMPGTLKTLDARFAAFRNRLRMRGRGREARAEFTNPPRARFARIVYDAPPRILLFDLRDAGGRFHAVDPARAGLLIPAWLADAAARLGPAFAALAERFVIGRGAGPGDLDRRVRAFPVPTVRGVGDRWIRRLAVLIPATCPLPPADLAWAFAGSEAFAAQWGRPVPADDRSMLERYTAAARLWQSETAVVLPAGRRRLGPQDRKTGSERAAEEAAARAAAATAVRHAGVTARIAAVEVRREPFALHGTPAGDFLGDPRFPKHARWHVAVQFTAPVDGPLLLGDGRFAGLGLMRPVRREGAERDGTEQDGADDILAFAIAGGLAAADAGAVAQALRRAVLARAGEDASPFVTGHGPAGAPLRGGGTDHVAYLADLPRARLLIVPPHRLDRRGWKPGERAAFDTLRRTMEGFAELRAGPAGRLALRPAVVPDEDPVFGTATVWESVTPYRLTRHPRDRSAEAALIADALLELRRRNLPEAAVTVLEAAIGRGGGIRGRLRLTFAVAVGGPILIGQSRQKGGGLFAACDRPGG
jgi:CRISPR-associated protein Csb2